MPKLPTFTANVGDPTLNIRSAPVPQTGAALAQLGRAGFQAADQLLRIQEQEDVRKVQLQAATIRADQTQALALARDEGGDLDKVRETFEDQLSQLQNVPETTAGRASAQLVEQTARQQFFTAVDTAKVSRAAAGAQTAFTDYMAVSARTITADPSTSEDVKGGFVSFVDTLPDLSPQARDRLVREGFEDIDSAAVKRFIDLDPGFSLQELRTGKSWPHLTPAQRVAAIGIAGERIQTEASRGRAEVRWQEHERTIRGEQAYNEGIKQLLFPKDSGSRSSALVSADQNPDMDAQQRINLYNINERLSEDALTPINSDPIVFRQLYERITAPFGSSRKLTSIVELGNFFIQGKLGKQDFAWLSEQLSQDVDPVGKSFNSSAKPFLDAIRKRLDKSTLTTQDPEGALRYMEFVQEFDAAVLRDREEGRDPRELFDPNGTRFSGRWPTALRRSGLDVIRETAGGLAAATPTPPTTVDFQKMEPITSQEQLDKFPGGFFKAPDGRLAFKPKGPVTSSAQ